MIGLDTGYFLRLLKGHAERRTGYPDLSITALR